MIGTEKFCSRNRAEFAILSLQLRVGGEDGVIEELHRFVFERLPKPDQPHRGRPCLAEDWFVDDARPLSPNWLSNNDLRRIWRVARLQRLGLHRGAGCPWLLLHQLTDLLRAIIAAWESIAREQGIVPCAG